MKTRTFTVNEKKLIETINNLNVEPGKVAIVGGHYMLLYEKSSDSLRPAVYTEFEEWGNRTFSKKETQNFPIKSFELTVRLYLNYKNNGKESKCVLLVNDDSFSKKNFRGEEHYEAISGRGLDLRRKYFSDNKNIPSIFRRILSSYQIKLADFFESWTHANSNETSLLPRESIFISERKLCRDFKKTVRNNTINSLFKIIKINNAEQDNVTELTVQSNNVSSVCLIEQGVCNCGGKAFQFYLDLIKTKGFQTIVFFVPEECKQQVDEGTNLICSSIEFNEKKITIIIVSNIESDPDGPVLEKDIVINTYSNK